MEGRATLQEIKQQWTIHDCLDYSLASDAWMEAESQALRRARRADHS